MKKGLFILFLLSILRFLATELSKLVLDSNAVDKQIKIVKRQENKVLDNHVGTYQKADDIIHITREKNQLYLQKLPFSKVPFHPISENEFFCYSFDGQLKFHKNQQSEIKKMIYTYEGVEEIWLPK